MQADPPITLDEVAARLVERFQSLMPAGGLYGRQDLERLPGPVEHVLSAVLERRAAREAALPDSEWIDPDDARIREASRQWRDAVRLSAVYPKSAWPEALSEATRQALRHLVEPAETAAAFCFEGEAGPIPIATVRARMTAFGPYSYLVEIAERYAERKEMDVIDRSGLLSLLRRIDRRMTGAYGPAEWSALAAPLFSLIGPLTALDGRVPSEVLRRFFAARGAANLAEATDAQPSWSAVELHDAVTRVLAPVRGGDAGAPAVDAPAAGTETIIIDAAVDEHDAAADRAPADVSERDAEAGELGAEAIEVPAGVREPQPAPATVHDFLAASADRAVASAPDEPDATPGDDPLADAFGADEPPTAAPSDESLASTFGVSEPPDVRPPALVPDSDVNAQEPLWQRLARTRGAGGDPLTRLEARVLGDNAPAQRAWLVAQIAGGSEGAYRRLLEGLDRASSWSEAWPVLAEAFKANEVDLYSDAAIAITDAAEARFAR